MDILEVYEEIDFRADIPRAGTCFDRKTGETYNFKCNCGYFISLYLQNKLIADMIPKDTFLKGYRLTK